MSLMSQHLKTLFTVFLLVFTLTMSTSTTHAQTSTPMVSFTFDDGFLSTFTNALPVLSARDIPATAYVTTSWINSGTTGDNFPAMNWDQVTQLQNQYGWEIGSHTVTHPQLNTLPLDQVDQELVESKETLQSHGINATSFASPYGEVNDEVVTESLKTYNSHRGFVDRFDSRDNSYNNTNTKVQSIEESTSIDDVQSWIDQAMQTGQWLILVLHNVAENYDPNYQWTTTNSELGQIADYIKEIGIPTMTVNQVVK
jgi:peptidoglycan/xylan/chitin deacetylase (PgdA/CDA1 family)